MLIKIEFFEKNMNPSLLSSHFTPVNPSLHEQTPLSFLHSKVVEPSGLHLHSEIVITILLL